MLDFSLWLLLFCSLVLLAVVRNPQIRLILESVDGGYFSKTSLLLLSLRVARRVLCVPQVLKMLLVKKIKFYWKKWLAYSIR